MVILITRVLVLLGQALSALGVVSGLVQKATQEHLPYQVESTVVATSLNIASPTFGLEALAAKIDNLQAFATDAAGTLATINSNVDGLGGPVTLPSTPPAGYGGLGVDDTFLAVWNAAADYDFASGSMGRQFVQFNHVMFNLSRHTLWRAQHNAGFYINGGWDIPASDVPDDPPDVSLSSALPGDTLLTWLEREAPDRTWYADYYFGPYVWSQSLANPSFNWIFGMSEQEFAQFLALRKPRGVTPPAWPGVDLATIGDAVDLADGVTITTPLDGVIISISSVPGRLSAYDFDGALSYRNLGGVTFFTEDGHNEFPQNLGFTDAIYCPKAIARAAGVKLRVLPGVVGTVKPWLAT